MIPNHRSKRNAHLVKMTAFDARTTAPDRPSRGEMGGLTDRAGDDILPADCVPQNGLIYSCFSADYNVNAATKIYIKRHGQPPAAIFRFKRLLWLGPVKVAP